MLRCLQSQVVDICHIHTYIQILCIFNPYSAFSISRYVCIYFICICITYNIKMFNFSTSYTHRMQIEKIFNSIKAHKYIRWGSLYSQTQPNQVTRSNNFYIYCVYIKWNHIREIWIKNTRPKKLFLKTWKLWNLLSIYCFIFGIIQEIELICIFIE